VARTVSGGTVKYGDDKMEAQRKDGAHEIYISRPIPCSEIAPWRTSLQLLLHQFLAGIPEAVSRQIRASGEVQDLEKAVERARLLMTVNETSDMGSVQAAATGESRPTDSVTKKLEEKVAKLTEQVAALSARTPQGSGRQRQRPRYLRCFKCNRVGHTQYECSYEHQMQTPVGNRRCFGCGRFGHIAQDCHPQRNQWAQGPSYQQQGNDQGMTVWGNRHPRQQ